MLPDVPKISSYLIGSWENRNYTEHISYARYYGINIKLAHLIILIILWNKDYWPILQKNKWVK